MNQNYCSFNHNEQQFNQRNRKILMEVSYSLDEKIINEWKRDWVDEKRKNRNAFISFYQQKNYWKAIK